MSFSSSIDFQSIAVARKTAQDMSLARTTRRLLKEPREQFNSKMSQSYAIAAPANGMEFRRGSRFAPCACSGSNATDCNVMG